MKITELIDPSNRIDLYCEKCQKTTVWIILWGKNSTDFEFFTGNAILEGWAGALFTQYGMCSVCETRIRYYESPIHS